MVDIPNDDELNLQITNRLVEELGDLDLRYRHLIDQMKEIVFSVDEEGVLRFLNRAWETELGFLVEDSLGAPIFTFIHPADVVKVGLLLGVATGCECFLGGGEIEVRFRSRGGEDVWMSMLLPQKQGETGRVNGSLVNITERKRVNDVLRESEERWKFALEGAGNGTWDWNLQRDEVYFSPRWKALLGYSDGELPNATTSWTDNLHPEDRTWVMEALDQYLVGHRGDYDIEFRMRCKDGGWKWINARGMLVSRTDEGKPLRMIGTHTDVTSRKLAEQLVHEREHELAEILSASSEGVVAFWSDARCHFVNQPLLRMFGVDRDSVIGVTKNGLFSVLGLCVDPEECAATEGRGSVQMGHLLRRVVRWERKELNRDGQEIGLIYFFRDVTRESEVDRMKSEFLATAAHELRTPMASIYGFVELLLQREFPRDTRQEMLGIVYEQTSSLIGMLNELLDLARIEARMGKDFNFQVVSLQPVLSNVVDAFRSPLIRHRILLNLPDRLPMVKVDEDKLRQALTNVLSNACKYSPDGGDVEIDIRFRDKTGESQVGVRVVDTGIGMNQQQISRMFERFYRADPSGQIPGTGLGLSLVKEIVQILGGEVEVDSGLGQGTRLTIWLPVAIGEKE